MNGKISKRTVDTVLPSGRDQFLWDTELPGFGLKVTSKGRKLYLLNYRTKRGRRRRYKCKACGPTFSRNTMIEVGARLWLQVTIGRRTYKRNSG